MNQELIQQLGDELYQAMLSRETVAPLTSRFDLTIDDAYQISLRSPAARRRSSMRREIW